MYCVCMHKQVSIISRKIRKGISALNAINRFNKQMILQKGLLFEVKLPMAKTLAMSELSKEELDPEIEKGYKVCLREELGLSRR